MGHARAAVRDLMVRETCILLQTAHPGDPMRTNKPNEPFASYKMRIIPND